MLPDTVIMNLGKLSVDSSQVEGLVTSSETPGGIAKATWTHCGKLDFDITDPVQIFDTQYNRYPFVGRISDIHRRGANYDVTATRSTRDRTYTKITVPGNPSHPGGLTSEKRYTAGTPFLQALTDALSLTPDVFDGGITDPGLQFVADTNDLGGQTAEQVWNYVSALTNGLATPLLWHVRGQYGQQAVVIAFQDFAARYFTLLDEDQIEETLSADAIVNEVAVAYGNGQVAYAPASGIIDHSVLKTTRTKYISAQNTVTRFADAQALAEAHLARYGMLRTVNDVLTLTCDKNVVRVVPPAHTIAVDAWPLWLIESGWGIHLRDRPTGLLRDKYITGAEYNWDSGTLTLRCGEVATLSSETIGVIDYNVNRLFYGPYNGPPGGNHPLSDADLLPKVGSELDSSVPPSTSYGVPGFKAAVTPGDPNVKYDKQLDPDIVPDEGLEANVNFDPSTLGFQAAIRTTPGTYSEYRLLLGNASGLVADTVVASFYRIIPISENPLGGTQFMFTVDSSGLKDRTAIISPPVTLKRGDYIMINVTTAASIATWAAVSPHAKKNFPRLKT